MPRARYRTKEARVAMSPEMHAEVQAYARELDTTISELLRMAVRDYMMKGRQYASNSI